MTLITLFRFLCVHLCYGLFFSVRLQWIKRKHYYSYFYQSFYTQSEFILYYYLISEILFTGLRIIMNNKLFIVLNPQELRRLLKYPRAFKWLKVCPIFGHSGILCSSVMKRTRVLEVNHYHPLSLLFCCVCYRN